MPSPSLYTRWAWWIVTTRFGEMVDPKAIGEARPGSVIREKMAEVAMVRIAPQ